MKNKLLLLMLLSTLSFSVIDVGDTEVDSGKNSIPDSNQSKDLIQESQFTADRYEKGEFYNVGLGEKTVEADILTEDGTRNLVDENGTTVYFDDVSNVSEEYTDKVTKAFFEKDSQGIYHYTGNVEYKLDEKETLTPEQENQIIIDLNGNPHKRGDMNDRKGTTEYQNLTDAEKEAVKAAEKTRLNEAKEARRDEMIAQGHSQKNNESSFLKGINSSSQGPGIISKMLTEPLEEKKIRYPNGQKVEDTNVTNFYSQNYGYRPYNNSRTKVMNSNANTIIDAYNKVDAIEDQAKSTMESTEIRCYITRELIPSYHCPIGGYEDVYFPDFLHGAATIDDAKFNSSDEALNLCNDSCKLTQECIEHEVQTEEEKVFPALEDKKIYPAMDLSEGVFILPVSDTVQASHLEFTIEIKKSAAFDGDDIAFNNFLRDRSAVPLKARYSFMGRPTDMELLPEMFINKTELSLSAREIRIKVPIYRQIDQYMLKFYKPYMYSLRTPSYRRIGEAEFFSKIESIVIKDIKFSYDGKNVYFCPTRQHVDNASDCETDLYGITVGSQLYKICKDNDHRIGEDRHTGGFFSKGSCDASCYSIKECTPSYKHYTDLSNKATLFKTSIGCVDENTNIGCQDSFCERLFRDSNIKPIEEIVIQSDDTKVYTIRNFLTTDEPRPKIDFVGEDMATTESDFNNTFQREMKDAAYQNMIKKQTFNRIIYPLGESSPERVAHIRSTNSSGTDINGLLKPDAFKFDTGDEYNIYSVVFLETVVRAKYGRYTIPSVNGSSPRIVDASNETVILKDAVYLIKDMDEWKLFKRIENWKIKVKQVYKFCPDEEPVRMTGLNPMLTQQELDNNCYKQNRVIWADASNQKVDRNVKYNMNTNTLVSYSLSELAPKVLREPFISDNEIKEYSLFTAVQKTINEIPGAYVRKQVTLNHGISFTRIFNITEAYEPSDRAVMNNFKLYLFTAPASISYDNIIHNKMNEDTIIYDNINRTQSKEHIPHDGEIDNNIEPFLLGDVNKMTLSLNLKPAIDEEGARVFKFIFLFNENGNE